MSDPNNLCQCRRNRKLLNPHYRHDGEAPVFVDPSGLPRFSFLCGAGDQEEQSGCKFYAPYSDNDNWCRHSYDKEETFSDFCDCESAQQDAMDALDEVQHDLPMPSAERSPNSGLGAAGAQLQDRDRDTASQHNSPSAEGQGASCPEAGQDGDANAAMAATAGFVEPVSKEESRHRWRWHVSGAGMGWVCDQCGGHHRFTEDCNHPPVFGCVDQEEVWPHTTSNE